MSNPSTIQAGATVYVYQPETNKVKAGWHETSVTRTWEEDGETVFETEYYVRDASRSWNEWSKSDRVKCWDWTPGTVSPEQDALFWSVFD